MYPDIHEAMAMRMDQFTFGSIRIDGVIRARPRDRSWAGPQA
jgi:hypothetical protein